MPFAFINQSIYPVLAMCVWGEWKTVGRHFGDYRQFNFATSMASARSYQII